MNTESTEDSETPIIRRFVSEWSLETSVEWRYESRVRLNRIIREYNEWQIDGFDPVAKRRVEALIDWGFQTFAKRDGASAYRKELEGMREFLIDHH